MSPIANASAVDALLDAAIERLREQCAIPTATYRIQFHAGFGFRDAAAIVPYLHSLGVSHVYASPYLAARKGSTHGYDVVDHGRLNPELSQSADDADYEAFLKALADHGMGHVLDTVPNHMGVGTNDNALWNDVLENGPASRYANHFDISWGGPSRAIDRGKVLLPVLGDLCGNVLDRGELKLEFDATSARFSIVYFDRRFPVSLGSYWSILAIDLHESVEQLGGERDPDYLEYVRVAHPTADRQITAFEIRPALAELVRRSDVIRRFVESRIALVNQRGNGAFLLDRLLQQQHYRLAYWRVAPDEINYRRFFDINDLAALSVQHKDVFASAHALTLRLVAQGHVHGLRVDHPDGLYDPKQYLRRLQLNAVVAVARELYREDSRSLPEWDLVVARLQQRLINDSFFAEPPLPVWVEKILAVDESLPADWATLGTSGYDPLNVINGLFVDPAGEKPITDFYAELTGNADTMADIAYQQKRWILTNSLASELRMLGVRFDTLAGRDRHGRDFTLSGFAAALRELAACFPVYRGYIDDAGPRPQDVEWTDAALREAQRRNPRMEPALLKYVRDVLLGELPADVDVMLRDEWRDLAARFQQLTAPATAKGIEDTAFYRFNRLISLNEVGGEPARFGVSPDAFHRYFADRQTHWPAAMTALSTHDTKRSEDVRARINVLSEIPRDWRTHVERWVDMCRPFRSTVEGRTVPTADEQYLFFQSLVGVWPFASETVDDASLVDRLKTYLLKAVREAKVHTSWTDNNRPHEEAIDRFIESALDRRRNAGFFESFLAFQARVARVGMVNSLAQTLLRLTAPGFPDTYQGTELWDLSLVDPDNRRPVDYVRRRTVLASLEEAWRRSPAELRSSVAATPMDGRIKLLVTWRALLARRQNAELFRSGVYLPLTVEGERSDHVLAFARVLNDGPAALVVVPRLTANLLAADGLLVSDWRSTGIRLPEALRGRSMTDVFTGERLPSPSDRVDVSALLGQFTVGAWISSADR